MADSPREGSRTERVATGLRSLFRSARDRARDQGIVEGSTMFFKSLAESVAFSHRNLRIGLAFVTFALVVVSASLGVLVARSFTSQERTRQSLERQMKGAGEDLAKQLQTIQAGLAALDERQRKLEDAIARAEEARKAEAALFESERAVLASYSEKTNGQLAQMEKTNEELRAWIQSFNRTYLIDRQVLVQRIDALAGPKR